MQLALPESYRAYCTDTAVRTAVDHILSSEDRRGGLGLPPNLDWRNLPDFHRAVLSAHQVRCERAIFLFDLWETVWRPVLAESGLQGELEPCTVADTEVWNGAKLDTNTIWTNQWFGHNFNVGGARYVVALGVSDDSVRVKLSLQFWGANDTDHTTGHNFGEDWPEKAIEDGCAWTSNDLSPIGENGMIDPVKLRKAAADAMAAVEAFLQD